MSAARSTTVALMPRWCRVSAAVSPPMPAPAMRTVCRVIHSTVGRGQIHKSNTDLRPETIMIAYGTTSAASISSRWPRKPTSPGPPSGARGPARGQRPDPTAGARARPAAAGPLAAATVRLTAAGQPCCRTPRRRSPRSRRQAAVDEVADLVRGAVAIGTVTAARRRRGPAAGRLPRRLIPAVEITLGTDNSDVLIDQLARRAAGPAIVSVGVRRGARRAGRRGRSPTRPSKRRCAATTRWRGAIDVAAGRAVRVPADRAAGRHRRLRRRLDEACAAAGVQPRIAFEATTPGRIGRTGRARSRGRDPAAVGGAVAAGSACPAIGPSCGAGWCWRGGADRRVRRRAALHAPVAGHAGPG